MESLAKDNNPGHPAHAETIQQAWQQVEQDWDNIEAHQRFTALCLQLDCPAEAGRRYREVRDSNPERTERASQQIDAIMAALSAQLELRRSPPPKKPPRWLLVCVFAICALFSAWFVRTFIQR